MALTGVCTKYYIPLRMGNMSTYVTNATLNTVHFKYNWENKT